MFFCWLNNKCVSLWWCWVPNSAGITSFDNIPWNVTTSNSIMEPDGQTRLEPSCIRLPRSGIRGWEMEREPFQGLRERWWMVMAKIGRLEINADMLIGWLRKRKLNPLMTLMGLSLTFIDRWAQLNMCKYTPESEWDFFHYSEVVALIFSRFQVEVCIIGLISLWCMATYTQSHLEPYLLWRGGGWPNWGRWGWTRWTTARPLPSSAPKSASASHGWSLQI